MIDFMSNFIYNETVIIISVLLIHWVADFICQSDAMAKNKSSSNIALSHHIAIYTAVMSVVFGPVYGIVNGLLHFPIDYVTSRLTSKLYKEGKTHDFFVVIGLDQFLHAFCLILTINLIYWL